jgi:hypothetical protein
MAKTYTAFDFDRMKESSERKVSYTTANKKWFIWAMLKPLPGGVFISGGVGRNSNGGSQRINGMTVTDERYIEVGSFHDCIRNPQWLEYAWNPNKVPKYVRYAIEILFLHMQTKRKIYLVNHPKSGDVRNA